MSATEGMLGGSDICDLIFSRSFALSLAARGADGKNWAKLAPDARDIVGQYLIYLSLRLPTIISSIGIRERLHAYEQRRRMPDTRKLRINIHATPCLGADMVALLIERIPMSMKRCRKELENEGDGAE